MAEDRSAESWFEGQEFQVSLNSRGEITDFLDPDRSRPNTPEERIRQKITQGLVRELGYNSSFMAHERSLNIGRERKRADIVIFHSEEAKIQNDQGRVKIIGEVKAPTEREPDGQLLSYLSATSAEGGFWSNGNSIVYYRKIADTSEIVEWIGLPRSGSSWDSIGKYRKSDLIVPIDLKMAFKRCHNAIYRSGIDSEDVALDMVRVILAKIEDESSSREECDFHITPREYLNVEERANACDRVRRLFTQVRSRHNDVFGEQEEITASDAQLAIVVSQLQQYAFLDAPHDVIGTAYEVYVASHLKGERGQFFTNRLVVEMMVRALSPTEQDIVLDPACGSGGFLLTAMNYIFQAIDNSNRSANAKEILKRNVVHNLFGVDISPKLVKIAKANMLLGKDGHGGIERGNSLEPIQKLSAHFQEKAGNEMPTMILTNPPFGAGHDIRVKEPNILRHYANGHAVSLGPDGRVQYENRLNDRQGVAPEILFLDRCVNWLKPGGVLAIVMAKGQLDNREAIGIRDFVLQNCRLLGVVNLHEDTFEPFCGSKASVIILRKERPPEDYSVFMAVSNKVGQTSRGEPIFKKDSEGNPIISNGCLVLDEDLSEIADDFHHFMRGDLEEGPFRFSVGIDRINEGLKSFNPVQYLPQYNEAYQQVIRMAESDEFELHTLGSIARVFNGPRFKRPYADDGVTEGPTIRKYFTGTALTQLNSDNVKYLDSSRANRQTAEHLNQLTIYQGYILISDSGTLGRVTYALRQHDGHVATNNLIRVVIEDEPLRAYVYQFLKSDIGQSLLLKNAYGTNQEHLEPDIVSEIPIPIPSNRRQVEEIGNAVISSIERLEEHLALANESVDLLGSLFR